MATVIANLIGFDPSAIFLNFTEKNIHGRQLLQNFVIVDVMLLAFKGSPAEFASILTDSNINVHMVSMGLRSVQVIVAQVNSSGTAISSTSTTSSVLPLGILIGVVLGGFFIAAAGVAYVFLRQKRQRIVHVRYLNSRIWMDILLKPVLCFAAPPRP
jgi:hypothetical protein